MLGAGDIEQKAQALSLRSKRDKGAAVISVVREKESERGHESIGWVMVVVSR